jgi:hypothetical protein
VPKDQRRDTGAQVPEVQDSLKETLSRLKEIEERLGRKEDMPRSKLRDVVVQDEVVSKFENISLADGGVAIAEEDDAPRHEGRTPTVAAAGEAGEGEEWVEVERDEGEWLWV